MGLQWDKPYTNWCRISSIHSIITFLWKLLVFGELVCLVLWFSSQLISPQERSGLRHPFFLIEGNQSQASNCTVYDTEEAKSLESAIYCKEAGSWFQHFNGCLGMFTAIKKLWTLMVNYIILHDIINNNYYNGSNSNLQFTAIIIKW